MSNKALGTALAVKLMLASARVVGDELDIQNSLETFFKEGGWAPEREVVLAATDRIDFMLGRLGVEVKVDGSRMQVMRQLKRYAESGQVDCLLLVTTCARHLNMPDALGGVPVHVVKLCTL